MSKEKNEREKAIVKVGADLIKVDATAVKAYLCANATKEEVILFLNQCQMFQLNPFKREIYLIKYGTSPAQIVVGYEAYIKRAERSKQWAGMESGIKGNLKKKDLVAWVKIFRKDWKDPLYHEVDYDEYVKTRKDGTITKFWLKMPKTMLKKVAISQAFRLAFPDEMAGMPYIVEEIDRVDDHQLPDSSGRYTAETEESKEAEEKADEKAEKAHISNYQVVEISRIEATLVDKFSMSPGDIIEKYAAEFKGKKKEDLTLVEADSWISILTKRLNAEIKKAEKAEEEPGELTPPE
ncbi:MAG: phage recombination protein Bet [Candidatus Aminicenantes bacterium]|nr:phage recombination protein Bet [Candidatus Aminicenantes bacterium]